MTFLVRFPHPSHRRAYVQGAPLHAVANPFMTRCGTPIPEDATAVEDRNQNNVCAKCRESMGLLGRRDSA